MIKIQEADGSHSRPRCNGHFPACLLESQCNSTVDRFWHKKGSSMATCSFLCCVVWRKIWQDLSAHNCWQIPQMFIYTNEWYSEQRPTYMKCILATRLLGDITVRHMDALHFVGLWMGKVSSNQYGLHYQKRHMYAKNWFAAPVKGFVSRTVVHAKNTTFRVDIYATDKDNVKTRLISVYVWLLLLYCKLTKHHPLAIWDS